MKNNKNVLGIMAGVILLLMHTITFAAQVDITPIELFSSGLADVVEYRILEDYDIPWGAADAAMVYDSEAPTLWALNIMGQGVGIRQSHPGKRGQQLLVFANPASGEGRIDGTVRISDDTDKTWKWSKQIEPGAYGYSCLAQLKDGNIGLFYEDGNSTLYFVKLTLEYLTGGCF